MHAALTSGHVQRTLSITYIGFVPPFLIILFISCIVQAVFKSVQAKNQALSEALQADAAEAQKLLQRQAAAEAQYDQGLQKLQATGRQLRSLTSKVMLLA